MAGRDLLIRGEPGFSLPAFERLAPPPPPDLVVSRIEGHTRPGDVVVDLHGRGGWVARAAVDRQRRAVTFESSPLTRLLAEVVLRPPDVRHLDAAFQAIATSPRQESSLKVSLGEMFATRCATCGRTVVADELTWEATPDRAEPNPRPVRKLYRCAFCRSQFGGVDQRHAPLDDDDLARAFDTERASQARQSLRERFPTLDGNDAVVDQLLALHTARQLVGLHAILERIEGDLRAEPVEAGLRLALLHALLPASRLSGGANRRVSTLRIAGGRVKLPTATQWRERNPWLAFEDGYRLVRGFVQRLEGSSVGPVQARFGEDLRSLSEGVASVFVRIGSPATFRALATEALSLQRTGGLPRIKLIVGQPPLRPNQDRLSLAYYGTAWVLGREAASTLPLEPLFGSAGRVLWGWQAASLRRALGAAEPLLDRQARVVLLLEPGGPEGLVAAVLGGVGAGYRLLAARLAEAGEDVGGIVEFGPPGVVPPSPSPPSSSRVREADGDEAVARQAGADDQRRLGPARTRANVPLDAGHASSTGPSRGTTTNSPPSAGLFAPPERFSRAPFSAAEAGRTVTESAVEILRARGEPAAYERLIGEILVGLDRTGQLRRLVGGVVTGSLNEELRVTSEAGQETPAARATIRPVLDVPAPRIADVGRGSWGESDASAVTPAERNTPIVRSHHAGGIGDAATAHGERGDEDAPVKSADQVEALLNLIHDELTGPAQKRVVEIEPGRWWLASPADQGAAALPLADRVEWAVFGLLSTAGRLSESAFFERIAGLFPGHDLPDETLVRACLQSYRSMASTPEALLTGDDLLRRSHEHDELVALLAETGHRLGMNVWIGRREQGRTVAGRHLASWLDEKEREAYLPLVARAPAEELEQVDCIWYVRNKATFMFEVEWTAMLGEALLRRHARIPQDDRTVRFLVVLPERTELVRYKLERSPLLRRAMEDGNWHVLKANHFRTFAARERPDLSDLEPLLGLDPQIERQGDQLPLFGG